MKKKLAKKYISFLLKIFMLMIGFIISVSCNSRSENLYIQATDEVESGNFKNAAILLEKTSQLEKNKKLKFRYLSEAARLVRFELQDYKKALFFFKKIILESDDENQRIAAQEAISEIYLENLQDYISALRELQILEPLLKDLKKKEKIRLRIAQTLYLTGNNQQALEEISSAEKYVMFYGLNFLKLKAEILLSEKKYKETLLTYEILRGKNPNYFTQENLYIAASIVYEENEQYTEALNYLIKNEAFIKDKSYYEFRIKRLKSRIANKPLSKGVHK